MTAIDWGLVVLYFAALIGIGVQTMRRIESSDDFAVAGNRIIWPVFFGSLAAAFLGGGASIGLAGQTWRFPAAMSICSPSWRTRCRRYWSAGS